MNNTQTSAQRQERLLPYSSVTGLPSIPLYFCRGFLLPLTVLFCEYGTIGLSAGGIGAFGGLFLTLAALKLAGLFVNASLFGDQLLTLFVCGAGILALTNICEIYSRNWRRDMIHRASPGLPRKFLVDWLLPASWCDDVRLMTVVFPALTVLFGLITVSHSPALGCYCLLGGIVMALQGAYVFWRERQLLMARRDQVRVESPRRQFLAGQVEGQFHDIVAGVVSSAAGATNANPQFAMPRAFRDLPSEMQAAMDLSLVQPPDPPTPPPQIHIRCPHCGKGLKGPATHCDRNIRCPGCRTDFLLTKELLS